MRMTDVEALMWNLEKDPFLAASILNVTILEREPDVEKLRRRLERASHVVPHLRQRVISTFGRLAPPQWLDDPNFDLDYHVRCMALPEPRDERTLFDLATLAAATPFDRTRPLWEFTVVLGLEGGRGAMIQKLHHTITDGEGGVRMSVEFIDFARDQPEPDPLPIEDAAEEVGPTNLWTAAAEAATHNMRRSVGAGRRLLGDLAGLAFHPQRVPKVGANLVAGVQSAARQLAITDRARSPIWDDRSLRRRFEVLRIPLDDTKRAAKELGGSVNDLFVAGAAGAAGAYHRAKGVELDELRIGMPVSRRVRGAAVGGNAFAPTRVLLPCAIVDPVERFVAVRDRLDVAKTERALDMVNALAGVINVLPTSVLVRLSRNQVRTVDLVTSNVRGAPFELFIAGARIEANYPMGPTGGTAFNITTLSSGGWLDMGVNVDLAAVDDPALLRDCLEAAYGELLAAGGVTPAAVD
jgi:diacylglycerol O-acyltransferase / wax synthase